jgi:hypothetical protein
MNHETFRQNKGQQASGRKLQGDAKYRAVNLIGNHSRVPRRTNGLRSGSESYPNGLLSSEPFSDRVSLVLMGFPGSDAKAVHDIAKPLNSLTLVERDAVLAERCRRIKAASGTESVLYWPSVNHGDCRSRIRMTGEQHRPFYRLTRAVRS